MWMRLHWQLRKLQCLNLCTHVITCHVTRATSLAVVGALMKAQFPNSQSEEYFFHPEVVFLHTTSTGININWIHPSGGLPAAWEHVEQQNSSSRCLWTPEWAFSQHQPRFHNSSLANKQPVCAQKKKGSGSGTGEGKKPQCKKCAFVPQETTGPGRQQHLEILLGLLRKRKERKRPDKFVSASLGLLKPQLVEVMAHLTTLVSSQHPITFLQEPGGTYPDMFT